MRLARSAGTTGAKGRGGPTWDTVLGRGRAATCRRSAIGSHRPWGESTMWPTSYALKELTPAEEKKIAALARKAVS